MQRVLLLILLMMIVSACSTSGTPNITGDMTEFLAQNGLSSTDLKCVMLGNGVTPGPDGMCLLSMTDTDASALVSSLGLQLKTDSVVSWQPSGPDCWTRLDFHDQSVANWYISPADNPHLQLQNGTRLVYFRLFYYRDRSSACISVAYPVD